MSHVQYTDKTTEGRQLLVLAQYQRPVFTPGFEEREDAYVLRIFAYDLLDKLAPGEDADHADVRLEMAHKNRDDYHRIRRECLDRVRWELDIQAGESGDIRRDARAVSR